MKAEIIDINGKKKKEINLPKVFLTEVREDLMKKAYESEQFFHPYGHSPKAGRQHSAAGIIRHLRHVWKSGYGRGMSRVPRKVMWRRGSQFYWIGAEVSGTRGGRRAHGPSPEGIFKVRKMNKKEKDIAINSAIASTAKPEYIKERYSRFNDKEIKNKFPLIIDGKILEMKTGELIKFIKSTLGELSTVAEKQVKVRAGKGKMRNRKYQKTKGVLVITGNDEMLKTKMFEGRKIRDVLVSDLYPAGRVVIYTENAINDLEKNDKKTVSN